MTLEYAGTAMDVEHALMGLQLRINTAKHLEGICDILSTSDFCAKVADISIKKEAYLLGPNVELGKKIQECCAAARSTLY